MMMMMTIIIAMSVNTMISKTQDADTITTTFGLGPV